MNDKKIFTKENVPFIFGIVCTLAGLIFGMSAIERYANRPSGLTVETSGTTELIPTVTETISESQASEVKLKVASATEAGQKIAELQTQLAKTEEISEIDNIFAELNPYFAEQQGVWSNVDVATFTFNTTYDFIEGVIPVSWVATDGSGNELVFVLAKYNSTTNTFSDVELYRTSYEYYLQHNDNPVDYDEFPGMKPDPTESTEPTEPSEPTETSSDKYPVGSINPDTGDEIVGQVKEQDEVRPIMKVVLKDGTEIYYTQGNDGMYYVCDENGDVGNKIYDPANKELI